MVFFTKKNQHGHDLTLSGLQHIVERKGSK